MIALEEEDMAGVGLALTDDHLVQCITGVRVLIMVVHAALHMIDTMVQHMTSAGVPNMAETGALNMVVTGADHRLEGREPEGESHCS